MVELNININDVATETTLEEINVKTPALVGGKVPVEVGTVTVTGALTDAQLRAAPVPISGTVTANTGLTQPITDTQLRVTPVNVAVSGGAVVALVDGDNPLVQPLTDVQLRATPVDTHVNGAEFTFSANSVNSTTDNLAVGASFAGTVESVLTFPAISVLFYADQSCIVTVFQYEDAAGSIPTGEPTQYIQYAKSGLRRSFLLNGNYIRVTVKNVGVATTTILSLDTAYGVIDAATQLNNNSVGLTEVAGGLTRDVWRPDFSRVIASGVDPTFFEIIRGIGAGQTVSQSGGNLVITAGTTANSETILRSTRSFTGSMIARMKTILSQRIVNQNFYFELVDVIGDGLACVINSATSITVTIPNNPFTAANVGQGMWIGAYSGTGTFSPTRFTIASVAGNAVTYTGASMAVGSGTCSVYGWNYYQTGYNGTTPTNCLYDAQRRGWNSGNTTPTINTTASPGHIAIMQNDDGNAYLSDQLVASSVVLQPTTRASRVENLPEENTQLFLQIRVINLVSAPASGTTWTVGMASVEKYSPIPTTINNIKPQGLGNTMPVSVQNTVPVSGSVTTSGTTTATLAASAVRAGFIAGAGIWYDDSSTNLGISATFTGTSRDLTVTATATPFASATTYAEELRVSAESDVTGTLWLEVSRDNTNWRRVKSIATAAVTGGGFAAEIIHRPSWRYARVGYTNGAGAQARFTIGLILTA